MRHHFGKQFIAAGALAALLVVTLGSPATAGENDLAIIHAVETDLFVAESVPAHRIDVQCKDGIVVLSGSVGHLWARDHAVRIARNIKGVRSVVNRIAVEAEERSDRSIRSDVIAALASDPATDSYEVTVEVHDGVVRLAGTVDSFQENILCADVVKGVRGVAGLDNQLQIDFKHDRADAEIESEVTRMMENDVRIDAYGVDVSVDDGVVTLTGTVGSAYEKSLARTRAWVNGVHMVKDDDLNVSPWRKGVRERAKPARPSDEAVQDAVYDAMRYDPRVWSYDVDVHANQGTVVLSGVVDNLKAKKTAEEDARNAVGVWRVKNHLKVRPPSPVSDDTLVERVTAAIARDPYVERYDVSVAAFDGIIHLMGKVDTRFEKRHAEDISWSVRGVVDVRNRLMVTPVWSRRTDREVRADVEDQLRWNPFVDAEDITVLVDDGHVTLTGSVDSWLEYIKVEESARAAGARSVTNKVEPRDDLAVLW